MSENAPELAEVPAPELEATAAIQPAENLTPDEQPEAEVETPKTFSQEELDAIISKRLAREQRKWEREQARRASETQARQVPVEGIAPEQFETYEAYADALAERKAEELLARRETERQHHALLETYHEREEAAREKYDDFEQVVYNPELAITEPMARAIQASDIGPDVAYHLGANPKEAQRIARLDPILQAREIGMIEARLAAAPLVKKTSNAPAPIAPVTARSNGTPRYDTTDPRSTKTMSASEWIEADRARQMKKWEAQRNR